MMQMVFQSSVISEAVEPLNSKNLLIDVDGVPSWVNLPFVADGVPSWVTAPEIARGGGISVKWYTLFPHWCHKILVMAPEMQEGYLFSGELSQCLCIKAWCHETMVMAPEMQEKKVDFSYCLFFNLVP